MRFGQTHNGSFKKIKVHNKEDGTVHKEIEITGRDSVRSKKIEIEDSDWFDSSMHYIRVENNNY